jgi:hypothetical protein
LGGLGRQQERLSAGLGPTRRPKRQVGRAHEGAKCVWPKWRFGQIWAKAMGDGEWSGMND